MGIAWGTLTAVVLLFFCGGMAMLAYSVIAECLTKKKRIYTAVAAVAAMLLGLMTQNAKARLDERITTLEFKVWYAEHGTAKKVIDALEDTLKQK